jgi:predicted SAM-dependent methyltransferase
MYVGEVIEIVNHSSDLNGMPGEIEEIRGDNTFVVRVCGTGWLKIELCKQQIKEIVVFPVCKLCGKPMASVKTGDLVVCDDCKKQKGIKEQKKFRLNIGCGDKILEGWTNIDKSFQYYQTQGDTTRGYGDATKLDFKSNCVDEIYASHVLDHLSRREELDKALSEWFRVLKPGGILRVAVSDFEKVVRMYNEGLDLERLWGHIVGGHKTGYDRHGCVFDFKLLKNYLEKHGFVDVKRYDWQDFLPEGFDDLSRCYIPHMDFNGILMSLNMTAKKIR